MIQKGNLITKETVSTKTASFRPAELGLSLINALITVAVIVHRRRFPIIEATFKGVSGTHITKK